LTAPLRGACAGQKLVVLQGLEDYIVADTKDVLLICRKEKEQAIKEYVGEVKRNTGENFCKEASPSPLQRRGNSQHTDPCFFTITF
jgi:hypothetical protein